MLVYVFKYDEYLWYTTRHINTTLCYCKLNVAKILNQTFSVKFMPYNFHFYAKVLQRINSKLVYLNVYWAYLVDIYSTGIW